MSSPIKAEAYDKYQAEDDLRTIQQANRIRKDPKRMAAVRRAAKEKLGEMNDLKALAGTK
jgi:hypothetical protein